MKKFILAAACLFALGANISAQNPEKKEPEKKECSKNDAKSCDKKDAKACDKKDGKACDKKVDKPAQEAGKKDCCKKDAKSKDSAKQDCCKKDAKDKQQVPCYLREIQVRYWQVGSFSLGASKGGGALAFYTAVLLTESIVRDHSSTTRLSMMKF